MMKKAHFALAIGIVSLFHSPDSKGSFPNVKAGSNEGSSTRGAMPETKGFYQYGIGILTGIKPIIEKK